MPSHLELRWKEHFSPGVPDHPLQRARDELAVGGWGEVLGFLSTLRCVPLYLCVHQLENCPSFVVLEF
jgi:hypothetical protein